MKFLIPLLFFYSFTAFSCLHYPIEYQATVTENKQEYFLFKNQQFIHLIAKTNLSAEKDLPDKLAWIFPLSSVPVRYGEVSPKIFNELHDFTFVQPQGLRGIESKGVESLGANSTLKVHEAQVVGRYKVRPLEILDINPKTATVLDSWLTSNGLKSMPREKQDAYLKKGAVFLVIEADLKGLRSVDFKPLEIVLKASAYDFSLPLNFTHEGREFDVDVYTYNVQIRPVLNKEKQMLNLVHSSPLNFPSAQLPEVSKLISNSKGVIFKYSGHYPGKGGVFPDPTFEALP